MSAPAAPGAQGGAAPAPITPPPFDNAAPGGQATQAALQQLLQWAETLPDAILQGYAGEF